jgi:hypothetical protein
MGGALIEEQHRRTIVGLCNSSMSECRKEDVQKPIIEELCIHVAFWLRSNYNIFCGQPCQNEIVVDRFLGIIISGVMADPSVAMHAISVILLLARDTGRYAWSDS